MIQVATAKYANAPPTRHTSDTGSPRPGAVVGVVAVVPVVRLAATLDQLAAAERERATPATAEILHDVRCA